MAGNIILKNGSKGEEVKKLQQTLVDAGYSIGSSGADGIFGKQTQAAVKKYQQDNGLTVDGIAGSETLSSLYKTEESEKPPVYDTSREEEAAKLYGEILKRPEFDYDINEDALYHQYRDQYINTGRLAKEDTVTTAAARTGGYGNSYAQQAGQQSFDAYLQRLNETVPELYDRALDRYNDETKELYNRYSLASDMADREFDKYKLALEKYQKEQAPKEETEKESKGFSDSEYRFYMDDAREMRTYGYSAEAIYNYMAGSGGTSEQIESILRGVLTKDEYEALVSAEKGEGEGIAGLSTGAESFHREVALLQRRGEKVDVKAMLKEWRDAGRLTGAEINALWEYYGL